MQSETVIIMIVGLLAIGLIRLVIAMVGREFAADHPHVKSKSAADATGSSSDETHLVHEDVSAHVQRPTRGTGKQSHLLYFPAADEAPVVPQQASDIKAEPAAS